jgi:hypothetical protein
MANIKETPPDPSVAVGLKDGKIVKTVEVDAVPDKPVTITTTTTSTGFSDFVPSIIPALQSSSYVLVLVLGFLAWSSRKLFVDFLTKHISLVDSLKENLDTQLETASTQMVVLKTLSENNAKLIENNRTLAETCEAISNGDPSRLAVTAPRRATPRQE